MTKTTGRPRSLTKPLQDEVCQRVASGETIRDIAADAHMPVQSTIYLTLAKDAAFSEQYALAREAQLQRWEDQIVEIADDATGDMTVDAEGNERVNHEHIQRAKVRIDTRKWLMSKRAPKKYGDKVEVGGPGGGPIAVQIIKRVYDDDDQPSG